MVRGRPARIEQGFTITRRPLGAASELTLVVGFAGPLRAGVSATTVQFLARSGRLAMVYGGLSARDARGRSLPVTLSLRGHQLLLGVNDAGARYPVRVDPLVQQGGQLTAKRRERPG
jgi:hypothetical protein